MVFVDIDLFLNRLSHLEIDCLRCWRFQVTMSLAGYGNDWDMSVPGWSPLVGVHTRASTFLIGHGSLPEKKRSCAYKWGNKKDFTRSFQARPANMGRVSPNDRACHGILEIKSFAGMSVIDMRIICTTGTTISSACTLSFPTRVQ